MKLGKDEPKVYLLMLLKKLVMWLAMGMVILMWPVSLLTHKVAFSLKTKTNYDGIVVSQINAQVAAFGNNRKVGRIFYNKFSYWLKLYQAKFFELVDLNNYFFNMHPRENVEGNAYLSKFPMLVLVYFVWGIFSLTKIQIKKWWWLGLPLLVLPVLNNFDGWDVVLYIPIILIIYQGWKIVGSKKYGWGFALILVVTAGWEYIRILAIK